MDPEVEWLVALLDEAFDVSAWHGPNLMAAVHRVDASRAAWRPTPTRHCIWEVALHCAYWKRRVRRRLVAAGASEGAGRFPPGSRAPASRGGSARDWPALPESRDAAAWQADVALLRAEHRRLREVVGALGAEALHAPAAGHRRPAIEHIRGIALHDIYHAGQIRLLRRMADEARSTKPR